MVFPCGCPQQEAEGLGAGAIQGADVAARCPPQTGTRRLPALFFIFPRSVFRSPSPHHQATRRQSKGARGQTPPSLPTQPVPGGRLPPKELVPTTEPPGSGGRGCRRQRRSGSVSPSRPSQW